MNVNIGEYQRAYGAALDELKSNREVLAVFVFGSMVSGDIWEKSDIDFFVILKKWQPGMTNVYSDARGVSVHCKFLSKKEFMTSRGFDLKGSFLHRLFASSRLVYCEDKDIETRFQEGRGYGDQARKTWTLYFFGKVIKGTDSVRKSLMNNNELAGYTTLMDTMNWYAMLLINRGGYMVSKDNINIAAELFSDFRAVFEALVGDGELSSRVESALGWILGQVDRDLREITEFLFRYMAERDVPLSANEIQADEIFNAYHIEAEAILSLLHEKGFLKHQHRDFASPGGVPLIKENVYYI